MGYRWGWGRCIDPQVKARATAATRANASLTYGLDVSKGSYPPPIGYGIVHGLSMVAGVGIGILIWE